MAKKPKQPDWSVYKLGKRAEYLGTVSAKTEAQALKSAFREMEIREADQFRISVRRDN